MVSRSVGGESRLIFFLVLFFCCFPLPEVVPRNRTVSFFVRHTGLLFPQYFHNTCTCIDIYVTIRSRTSHSGPTVPWTPKNKSGHLRQEPAKNILCRPLTGRRDPPGCQIGPSTTENLSVPPPFMIDTAWPTRSVFGGPVRFRTRAPSGCVVAASPALPVSHSPAVRLISDSLTLDLTLLLLASPQVFVLYLQMDPPPHPHQSFLLLEDPWCPWPPSPNPAPQTPFFSIPRRIPHLT